MRSLNIIKKIFLDYVAPCTIFVGTLLLFLVASNMFFFIKRFYLFILFVFLITGLTASVFVMKHKIARTIHVLLFLFFGIFLSLIAQLTITQKNPWALFYEIQTIGTAAQTVYYEENAPETFPTKAKVFSTYLNLELQCLLNKKAPAYENIFGFNMTFHAYPELAAVYREIFIDKDYDIKLGTKTPFIIDCGCNEGLSLLFFKLMYPDSKIIGFEAHPKNFQILQENVQTNKLSDITLINKAVFDTEGTVKFSRANNIGSHLIQDAQDKDFITVDAVLLSDYISGPVDLLKMDIEGAESAVIKELAEHKKLGLIKNIIMEFHLCANKNYNNFAKTLSILEENGFSYLIKKTDQRFQYSIIRAYKN